MNKSKYTDQQLKKAVLTSKYYREVLKKLKLSTIGGGSYNGLKFRIQKLKLDTSHFVGQGWRRDKPSPKYKLKEILIKNSHYQNVPYLKHRIVKEGLLPHQCNKCKRKRWEGFPIPLQLHHKNGKHLDHRLKNLELLCPNCHTFTDTYCGKNI